MKIEIISVGKKHDLLLESAINNYEKRLKQSLDLTWTFISSSTLSEDRARKTESEIINKKLKPDDEVWLLDERGELINNIELVSRFNGLKVNGKSKLIIVIGGAYGVDDSLRERANFIWSLSKLVFPHQLTRLILIEQLYRTSAIERGSGYHHN